MPDKGTQSGLPPKVCPFCDSPRYGESEPEWWYTCGATIDGDPEDRGTACPIIAAMRPVVAAAVSYAAHIGPNCCAGSDGPCWHVDPFLNTVDAYRKATNVG